MAEEKEKNGCFHRLDCQLLLNNVLKQVETRFTFCKEDYNEERMRVDWE